MPILRFLYKYGLCFLMLIASMISLYAQDSALIPTVSFSDSVFQENTNHENTDSTYIDEYTSESEADEYDDEQTHFRFSINDTLSEMALSERNISDSAWKALTADKAFNYKKEKERDLEKENKLAAAWANAINKVISFFGSMAGQIILWLIIASAIVFIVLRIIKNKGFALFAKTPKKMVEEADAESDDYIPENWEERIAKAKAEGHFRLAIRLGFRHVLQLMNEKEIINYQISKTNYQYAYDLSGTAYKQPYMAILRDYEYAWYGGFDVSEKQYQHFENSYNALKNQL